MSLWTWWALFLPFCDIFNQKSDQFRTNNTLNNNNKAFKTESLLVSHSFLSRWSLPMLEWTYKCSKFLFLERYNNFSSMLALKLFITVTTGTLYPESQLTSIYLLLLSTIIFSVFKHRQCHNLKFSLKWFIIMKLCDIPTNVMPQFSEVSILSLKNIVLVWNCWQSFKIKLLFLKPLVSCCFRESPSCLCHVIIWQNPNVCIIKTVINHPESVLTMYSYTKVLYLWCFCLYFYTPHSS